MQNILQNSQENTCVRISYSGPAEIASFFSGDLSRRNKHATFWHVVSTGHFYVLLLRAIAVSQFCPLEIYKNLNLLLSTISFAVNSHAFLEVHLFGSNIIQYEVSFFIKMHDNFFIFKFDLNIKYRFYFFK